MSESHMDAQSRAMRIHQNALQIVKQYRKCEVNLIEILQAADKHKVYFTLGHNSLFRYAVDGLGLSEEVAYIFINVARKAREVPALKEAIAHGQITVSKAKRITPVLNQQNQKQWLDLAKSESKREIERLVAATSPKLQVRDKTAYVNPLNEVKERVAVKESRVQLQVGIAEEVMLKIRRAQEVLSQKRQRPVSLEEVLHSAFSMYLSKEDPLEIAKRQKIKGRLGPTESQPTEQMAPLNETAKAKFTEQDLAVESRFSAESRVSAESRASEGNNPQVPGPVPYIKTPGTREDVGAHERKPVSAELRHKLTLKFQGQCAHVDQNGNRCSERKFLHVHHVHPVSNGGRNELNNLILLCAGHHRMIHFQLEQHHRKGLFSNGAT